VLLLEIAAQGVRAFAPQGGRIAFRPGYNVVAGDGAALRRIVAALLFPDRPPDPALRAEGASSGASIRAGLTLAGDDGVTWRVVRDLGGPCHLQRYDPERRAFQSVLQDPARIAEVLRAAGAPSAERYAVVLSVAASDFPSRQSPAGLAAASAPPPAARRPAAPDETRRKLDAARDELERAHGAERLQGELDGLQSRLFKLEEMLKSGEQVRERLRSAQAGVEALARGEAALGALQDPAGRIAACARATNRRDEAIGKVAEEREAHDGLPTTREGPLWRVPGFLAGAGIGAAALLGALASGARWLALLAIPATAAAAYEGLRWVGRVEGSEQAVRRSRWFAERERKAREAWERETADVRAAITAAGVANLAELSDLAERLRDARAALADAEAGMTTWAARAETQDAEAERTDVAHQIGELERELTAGTGGFIRDVQSIQAEIDRLERDLEAGPGVPAATGAEVGEVLAPPPRGEALRVLMERASADLGLTMGAALRALQPRVVQLLPALSGQRLANFFADERGNLQVQAGGKLVPASTLTPAERDLCFAVLKVGFVEQGLAAGKSVAILDDAFAALPEGTRRALARALKQLARGRQIVHGTGDPIFREAADHAG